jgi:hypothetical protein
MSSVGGTETITVNDSDSLDLSAGFGTCTLWAKWDGVDGDYVFIVSKKEGSEDFKQTDGYMFYGSGGASSVTDVLGKGLGGTNVNYTRWTGVITDTNWHHYTAVWDNFGVQYLYIDGRNITGGSTTSTPSLLVAGTSNLLILHRTYSISSQPSVNGLNDDVRFYNRVLSVSEISSLALSRSRLLLTDGLVGWWKLDEGTNGQVAAGATVKDYSGFGNTGTVTNSPVWSASNWINYP